ncbi:MAG TPA: alpha/beta hydrolase [Gaiella sp.]
MTLALHAWGDDDAPRVVCLHGVTMYGGHFRVLAEDWLAESHRVLAPDLLGHGSSAYEPPWSIDAHIEAILATVGREPAHWIGHSFGARLAYEIAAREPRLVDRLVLLDPAIVLAPHVALFAAENARRERTYVSFEEAIDRRYEESSLHGAPRRLLEADLRHHLVPDEALWRYRYCQSAVVTAYAEMATAPPPFAAVRLPTLLLLGAKSYLPYDHLLEEHRAAAGELLTVATVDGGHSVLWDALEETAGRIVDFLSA